MPISCVPSDLAEAAKSYSLPQNVQDSIEIYVLATWANGGTPPPTQFGFLIQDAADGGGYILLNNGGKIAIQL